MELVTQKDFSKLATDKIAKELSEFKGDRYGQAVKTFVASTLTNFCGQSQRFAQVVYETPATLSDCCAEIMKGCGSHISDIDVYRGAVRYYFPGAEIEFTLTIDASGDMPTPEEMAKPRPQPKPAEHPPRAPKVPKTEKTDIPAPEKKKPEKPAQTAPEKKPVQKPKKPQKADKDDGLIQLSLF